MDCILAKAEDINESTHFLTAEGDLALLSSCLTSLNSTKIAVKPSTVWGGKTQTKTQTWQT